VAPVAAARVGEQAKRPGPISSDTDAGTGEPSASVSVKRRASTPVTGSENDALTTTSA
jgi:hypothetical protein